MKASTILAASVVACVLGVGVRAQAQDAPKEHSMTGCLAKGDATGTFKLTDLEKGPKEVVIAETTANLTPHVGHKVEITGVAVPGKDKTHTMKVTAVKMISTTCP
jgi:small ligand-binding sensory domain FIST